MSSASSCWTSSMTIGGCPSGSSRADRARHEVAAHLRGGAPQQPRLAEPGRRLDECDAGRAGIAQPVPARPFAASGCSSVVVRVRRCPLRLPGYDGARLRRRFRRSGVPTGHPPGATARRRRRRRRRPGRRSSTVRRGWSSPARTPSTAAVLAVRASRSYPPSSIATVRPAGTCCTARARQGGEVARAQAEIGQRIGAVGVEARRDQQPRRGEAVDDRGDDLVERPQIDVAGGRGRQRHVDRGPGTAPAPVSVRRPVPGIQRPLVGADEQDRGSS